MSLRTELSEYSEDVIAGRVVACEKHRWACMRFLRELEREGSNDFPFVFVEEAAERFFRWMRLFKHRKGVLKGKHIVPAPILRFVFGNVYGWRDMHTGYRRYTKMYWQVARKNAKSQSLGAVGTYELMALDPDGIEAQEVYCAATKRDQAKIVYDEAVAMLNGCDLLKGKFREAYGKITHTKTGSVMRALSEEDRKTGDGLNPQCGIIDEYHAHETSEVYDVLDSGMGARAQPLLAIITTAGFDLENPCYRVEYDLVKKILDPDNPVELDSYFAMVNEVEVNQGTEDVKVDGKRVAPGDLLDDVKDVATWEKANPIICSYPEGVAYLKKKCAEAELSPEKLRNFLTKHMNVWVNQRDAGYMNLAKWSACRGELPDLRNMSCWVGLDLSAKNDMTSVGFEFRQEDQYLVRSHSFIPETRIAEKMKTDRVPYDQWVRDGWITATAGEVVDYRAVVKYAKDVAADLELYIEEWCVDPWGSTQISADLIDEGYVVVDIVQGIKTLSEPTKDFRNMVLERRVVHDGNPVLAWAMGNAIADAVDRNENIILSKKKSRQRIDPVAAIINAHTRAMVAEPVGSGPRVLFI